MSEAEIRALTQDLSTLGAVLGPVEQKAKQLPWAGERPWTRSTHLGSTNGLPTVDLHSLSVRLALEVVHAVLESDLECGGAVLITGRGRHTGGHSKLKNAVLAELERHQSTGRIAVRPLGPGRTEVIVDEARVRQSRPGMGLLFWLLMGLLALAAAAVVLNRV